MPFWFRFSFTVAARDSDKNNQEALKEVEKYIKEKYPDLHYSLLDYVYVPTIEMDVR